jgi:hypothetical protein
MSPDQIRPLHKILDRNLQVSGKVSESLNPLELLIRAIEEADAKPDKAQVGHNSEEEVANLDAWVEQCLGDALLDMPLSTEALAIVSELAPPASLTEAFLDRVEAKRKAARANQDSIEKTFQECRPDSPGDVIRFLRDRAGASVERAAAALGTNENTLLGIERHTTPLLAIDPGSLRAFADLVGEPLKQLLTLLRLAAKRLLTQEILSSANVILGRFDEMSNSSTARRERLKLAFARASEENQHYALFFQKAATENDGPLLSVDP